MKKYNHAFTLAFSIDSDHPEGEDLTSEDFRKAIESRMNDLDSSGEIEWTEALGLPYDTYENEEIEQ